MIPGRAPRYQAMHPRRPYDGEISFVDTEVGRLLAGIGTREDLLVVVVSDHGESNDEHGEPQHGFLLYQSTLRIAALASGPGVPRGLVRTDLVSLVDVEPTLARVLDLPAAGAPVRDGRALLWDRAETKPVTAYAEAFRPLVSYSWSELRALRRGPHKLIEGAPTIAPNPSARNCSRGWATSAAARLRRDCACARIRSTSCRAGSTRSGPSRSSRWCT